MTNRDIDNLPLVLTLHVIIIEAYNVLFVNYNWSYFDGLRLLCQNLLAHRSPETLTRHGYPRTIAA